MPAVNLSSTAPQPEGEDPESTIDFPEDPPPKGGGKTTRLLLYLLVLVVVGAGGFFVYQYYFSAPAPPPFVRPVQPLAKAPTPPPAASPAPGAPASPAPPPGGSPAGPLPAGPPGGPVKAQVPAKTAASPAGAPGPPGASASPSPGATAAPTVPALPIQTPSTKDEAKGMAPVASLPPPQASTPRSAMAGIAPATAGFSLQLGAMLNEANAQKLKQRLDQLGYAATVRKGVANVRRHVVTVGDFPDRAAADDLAKRLTGQGMQGRAIQAGARYTVEAGTFATEDDAIDLARAIQKLNNQARIQDLQQNTTLYQVRVGNYASREEARAKGSELEGKGFRYFIVKN